MKALLPDHRGSVAGWGVERGHWKAEKGRRDSREGDIRIFEGDRRSGSGGRWEDEEWTVFWRRCLTRRGTGCGVGRTPDSASRPKHPYREFPLRKPAGGELALEALNDPHPAPSQELSVLRLAITPLFQWGPGRGPCSISGTIASSQILRLPASLIDPQSPRPSASLRFPALQRIGTPKAKHLVRVHKHGALALLAPRANPELRQGPAGRSAG